MAYYFVSPFLILKKAKEEERKSNMKILIIRHAEPDYALDSLTEKGFREAKLLGEYLHRHYPEIVSFYVSLLGRAKKTFEASQSYYPNSSVQFCPWLVEFTGKLRREDKGNKMTSCWDLLPSVVEEEKILYTENWMNAPLLNEQGATVKEEYQNVIEHFDAVLAEHGYIRDGFHYVAKESNHDVIAFFCHFGVASVLLSHLMNCSPYSLWQNSVLLPSSLTEFVSEERRKGVVSFRANKIGSLAHLEPALEEESFAARFCECFEDKTRHD